MAWGGAVYLEALLSPWASQRARAPRSLTAVFDCLFEGRKDAKIGGRDMLKQAREYRLFSRTIMPLYALYTAGWVIGGLLYLGSGRLGLLWGPLGELRRAFTDTQPVRAVPASSWMNWLPVLLCGAFVLAELRRGRGHRASGDRVLLAAYSVATLGAASVVLARDLPEVVYGAAAVLAATLFIWALWGKWTLQVRAIAVGAVAISAGISMALLRLRDMAHLGRLRW